ncbi:MAG: hypothetical protein OXL41_07180 [Nitrospinae bacterium]|nr:hypothetical protein [Nitrospinota bacterium]
MSQHRPGISIIAMVVSLALASYGCGGGGGTATGGAFNSAVIPGTGTAPITKSSESENAVLDNPPPDGSGGNGGDGPAPDAQTEQEPDDRNTQAEPEPAGDANRGDGAEEDPADPTGPAPTGEGGGGETASLGNPPPNGGGGNGGGGPAPDAQTEQEPVGNANQEQGGDDGAEKEPGNLAGPAPTGEGGGSETASLDNPPPDEEEKNGPGGTTPSPTGGKSVSPSGGKSSKAPGGSTRNAQNEQEPVDNGNPEDGEEEEPAGPADPASGTEDETTPVDTNKKPKSLNSPTFFRQPKLFDYSNILEGYFPLPPGHGYEPGQIVVPRGFTEQIGDTIISCPGRRFGLCIIDIDENGTASYDENELIPTFRPELIMLPQSGDAAQAPVFDFVNVLHVGANVAPRAGKLTGGVDRGGVSVSYGEIRDGFEAERLLEFMEYHVRLEDKIEHTGVGGAPGLETFAEPPTIRLAEGTSEIYARYAAHAVQLINSALPFEKRITLGAERLPAESSLNDIPEGEILLRFAPRSNFDRFGKVLGQAALNSSTQFNPDTQRDEAQGAINASIAINEARMRDAERYNPELEGDHAGELWEATRVDNRRVANSDTLIKWFNDQIFVSVVVHELVHALGFFHIDKKRFPASIMNPKILTNQGQVNVYTPYLNNPTFYITVYVNSNSGNTNSANQFTSPTTADFIKESPEQPNEEAHHGHLITPKAGTPAGHILFPIDRAALLAAYDRLQPGAQPEDLTAENLGSWSDTSFHLRGDVDFTGGGASFGVASANGFAQPWATGPAPWTNLADNQALSGSATWNGALLGVDSSSETVSGDAALTVNLTSLTGQLDFTGLEKWGAGEAPGAAGSGTTWGDGDLGYTIEVRDNTFVQTGGDEGYVTGAFFGAAHEAMGGVLERADLAAGFGGTR